MQKGVGVWLGASTDALRHLQDRNSEREPDREENRRRNSGKSLDPVSERERRGGEGVPAHSSVGSALLRLGCEGTHLVLTSGFGLIKGEIGRVNEMLHLHHRSIVRRRSKADGESQGDAICRGEWTLGDPLQQPLPGDPRAMRIRLR